MEDVQVATMTGTQTVILAPTHQLLVSVRGDGYNVGPLETAFSHRQALCEAGVCRVGTNLFRHNQNIKPTV